MKIETKRKLATFMLIPALALGFKGCGETGTGGSEGSGDSGGTNGGPTNPNNKCHYCRDYYPVSLEKQLKSDEEFFIKNVCNNQGYSKERKIERLWYHRDVRIQMMIGDNVCNDCIEKYRDGLNKIIYKLIIEINQGLYDVVKNNNYNNYDQNEMMA